MKNLGNKFTSGLKIFKNKYPMNLMNFEYFKTSKKTLIHGVDLNRKYIKQRNDNTVSLIKTWGQAKRNQIEVKRTKGIHVYDKNDHEYLDLTSGVMCVNLGHMHPTIMNEINRQTDELTFAAPSFATKIRAELSIELEKFLPKNLKKSFFCLGDAEANENAIKMARFSTGRQKIMSRYYAYHGSTCGALSISSDTRKWSIDSNLAPGVVRTVNPYAYRCPIYEIGMSEEDYTDRLIRLTEMQLMHEDPYSFASIHIETVTGQNGVLIPPKNYIKRLRELCTKYGILLVCDEVDTGFGRTGKWFALDHYGVECDILVTASTITGGHIPLGLVAVSEAITKQLDERVFYGGLTYQGHPLCLAAAKGALIAYQEENILEKVAVTSKILKTLSIKMMEKHKSVGTVRSIGLFGVLELVSNRRTK
jgi:taurine--2-oxoglutarate transaminase